MPGAPWPLIEIAVAPTSEDDRSRVHRAALDLVAGEPELDLSFDAASGQFVLKATTETCLDLAIERLRTVEASFIIGRPSVAYRERLIQQRVIEYTHKCALGASGQFARVKLLCEPGAGYAFEAKTAEDNVPSAYHGGIAKGLESVLAAGVLIGFPVIDVRVELIDGAYHVIDSSPHAFEIAARAAFRQALQGNSVVTEPVMAVEATVPEQYAVRVIGDLQGRRAVIRDKSVADGVSVLTAAVPLADMLGYASRLRSLAGDEASVNMTFSHYAPVPSPDLDPPPMVAALRA